MKSRIPEQEQAKLNGDIKLSSYDLNKQLILSLGEIKPEEKEKFKNDMIEYFARTNKYYMLLCKEQSYYTVFHRKTPYEATMYNTLLEIIEEIGTLYAYSIDEENGGVEIWIKPALSEEVFVYYFFPYDQGIVEA